MPRSVHADVITALQADNIRMANIISLYFSSTLYITDYGINISYGGATYEAINGFLGMSEPAESKDLRVNSVNLTVSGVDQSFISIFLNQNWINRRVIIRRVVLDSSNAVIGTPISLFDGQISQFQIDESVDSSEVTISVASQWADFERKAGRLTNNNSQQYFFSGDKGFEFAANTVADIKWGRL